MSGRGENYFQRFPKVAAAFYDSLAQTEPLQAQYRAIAEELSQFVIAGRILDIGTGSGYLLKILHDLNPELELFCIDISQNLLNRARSNLSGVPVELRLENITSTTFEDDFFDLITCTGSFYLWNHPHRGLAEIWRLLKPGHSAYLYETHRDFRQSEVQIPLKKNLESETYFWRLVAPRMLIRQLRMSYSIPSMINLLESSIFAGFYEIRPQTIANLPVWLRIKLEKEATPIAVQLDHRWQNMTTQRTHSQKQQQ